MNVTQLQKLWDASGAPDAPIRMHPSDVAAFVDSLDAPNLSRVNDRPTSARAAPAVYFNCLPIVPDATCARGAPRFA